MKSIRARCGVHSKINGSVAGGPFLARRKMSDILSVVGPHGPTKYEDIQNSGYKVTAINEYILLFRRLWSQSGVEPNVDHRRRGNQCRSASDQAQHQLDQPLRRCDAQNKIYEGVMAGTYDLWHGANVEHTGVGVVGPQITRKYELIRNSC